MTGALDEFNPGFRQTVDEDTARAGWHLALGQSSDVLFSFIHAKRQDDLLLPDADPAFSLTTSGIDEVDQFEGQYMLRTPRATWIAGAGGYDLEIRIRDSFGDGSTFAFDSDGDWRNAYVYGDFALLRDTRLLIGASYDRVTDAGITVEEISPKVGLYSQLTPSLLLRIAAFQSKPALVANQTVQPTQIRGLVSTLTTRTRPSRRQ